MIIPKNSPNGKRSALVQKICFFNPAEKLKDFSCIIQFYCNEQPPICKSFFYKGSML